MKSIKNTNTPIKLAALLIFLALLAELVLYAVQAIDNPYRTMQALETTLRDSVRIRGIVVREEEPLLSVFSAVYLTAEDGKRVRGGQAVAEAFDSEAGLQQAVQAGALEDAIAGLEALRSSADGSADLRQLEEQISAQSAALRAAATRREGTKLEELSRSLRTLAFTAFSEQDEVSRRLEGYRNELNALERQERSRSTQITAPRSGLFSTAVDGLERLTPKMLREIGVSALEALLEESGQPSDYALGKLVYGSRWYFAALLDDQSASRLRKGGSAGIYFGRYYNEELTMRVEWISPEEEGRRAVLFSCGSNMTDIMGMRLQEAELIFQEQTGIRVPRQALHVSKTGQVCVFVQTGLQAEEKAVEVLQDYGDYYVVSSSNLRVGDLLIVSGKELTNGKVVG